jgi:uncharacterized protein YlaI
VCICSCHFLQSHKPRFNSLGKNAYCKFKVRPASLRMCDQCAFAVATFYGLTGHIATRSGIACCELKLEHFNQRIIKLYMCDQCINTFATFYSLISHVLTHSGKTRTVNLRLDRPRFACVISVHLQLPLFTISQVTLRLALE